MDTTTKMQVGLFDETDSLPNLRCRVWHIGQERLEHGSCACARAHWHWCLCEHGHKRGRGFPLLVPDQAVESAVYQLVHATAFWMLQCGMKQLLACFHQLNSAMAYLLADLFGIFAELIHSCSFPHYFDFCRKERKAPCTSQPCSIRRLVSTRILSFPFDSASFSGWFRGCPQVCDLPADPDKEVRSRCVQIIQTLISAKANLNPRNSRGSTPLMLLGWVFGNRDAMGYAD